MKKIISSFGLLLLSLSPVVHADNNTLSILTYNVHALNPSSGANRPFADNGYFKIAEAIKASQADIVCSQETYDNFGTETLQYLGANWAFIKPSSVVHTGIFYRKDILTLNQEYYDSTNSWYWLGGEFKLNSTNAKFRIFSSWLSSASYGPELLDIYGKNADYVNQQESQLRTSTLRLMLNKYSAEIKDAREGKEPFIICGDFNSPVSLDHKLHESRPKINWPGDYLVENNFTDSLTYGDLTDYMPNPSDETWSTIYKIYTSGDIEGQKQPQDRIDFIYTLGINKILKAYTTTAGLAVEKTNQDPGVNENDLKYNSWGSDHKASYAEIEWFNQ